MQCFCYSLEGNQIGDGGAEALADNLKYCTQLEYILYVILRDIQLEKRPILIDIGPPNSHLRYPIELFRTHT